MQNKFGVWCNGNTADSGPAFPGSSPGTPTKRDVRKSISFFVPSFYYAHEKGDCFRNRLV